MSQSMPFIRSLSALAAALCLAASAQASIVFSSDTSTELKGNWLAVGETALEFLSASAFANFLPLANPDIGLVKFETDIFFGADGIGSPDNPFFGLAVPSVDTVFADFSGTFNNNPSNTTVYFLFSGLSATAGAGGTFEGDFCFSTSSTTCVAATVPEPATLALVGLALLGAGAARGRFKG